MGDIIQVLIIIGIIVFAIVKQLDTHREKEKKEQRPPVAQPEEYDEDWEEVRTVKKSPKPFLSYDYDHSTPFVATTAQPPSSSPPEEPDNDDPAFDIRSAEEVKRAIIWSEILNRKY